MMNSKKDDFSPPHPLIQWLPKQYRFPLSILSTVLVLLGLILQGLALTNVYHVQPLPIIQVALIAHGVEALLGISLASRYHQSPIKVGLTVFFTGAIGLVNLVDP